MGLSDLEKQPPRILVIGPENSGKTTACKITANYAVRARQRWSPILVNLDPGEVYKISQHNAGAAHFAHHIGRMDSTRNNICLSCKCAYSNLNTSKSIGFFSDIRTDSFNIIGTSAIGILVRPC
jgi:hypothetical protein